MMDTRGFSGFTSFTMYAQQHITGVDLASDSGSTNMSISVMTSISEQNERVSLDDDCPDYDAVVNRKQVSDRRFYNPLFLTPVFSKHSLNARYLTSLQVDDSRSSLPRTLKGMALSSERHMSSDASRRNPRPLPRLERYIYTYRLVANGAPLHFLISCAKIVPPLFHDS